MTSRQKQKCQIFTDEGMQFPPSFYEGCMIGVAETLLDDYGWGNNRRQRHVSSGEVTLVLTDDATIHDMNRRYRGIDRPTDVLSFDMADDDGATGEIYVSLPTAERQANEIGIPVVEELYRLFLHGLLHIVGRDDQTEEEAAAMTEETERYMGYLMDLVKESDVQRG